MFLVHHTSRGTQVKTLVTRTRSALGTVYEGLLRPVPEAEAVYLAVSSHLGKIRGCAIAGIPEVTVTDRRLMHEYASTLLLRDPTAAAPSALNPLFANRVRSIVTVQQFHYRRNHPWKTLYQKATA